MKLINPVPSCKLLKHPQGNIYQFFAENPELYMPFGLKYHNGIDIATFDGDKVCAAHDGVVADVRLNPQGYGNSVLLLSDKQLDGTYILTRYSHLRLDVPVVAGQEVKAGDIVGYESNTGFVISGNTPFWGNAPAGKGVHLHFGVLPLKEVEPNSYQYYFPSINKSLTAINGDNGVHGYEDPMPYFQKPMYNLVKNPLKTSEIYAVIGTTKRHIGNYYTLSQGNGVEWSFASTNDIPFADVTAFAALTEGAEIVFTPHD